MNRLMIWLPLAICAGLVAIFAVALFWPSADASSLEGRRAPLLPAVALGGLETFDGSGFDDGEVKIVNFWASWCPPCRAEHASLMELAAEGVPIYGVNKSDRDAPALAFLQELGNPFTAVTVDATGRGSLEWGVAALPETFVVDGEGRIVTRFAGPILGVMDTVIRPALAEAAAN